VLISCDYFICRSNLRQNTIDILIEVDLLEILESCRDRDRRGSLAQYTQILITVGMFCEKAILETQRYTDDMFKYNNNNNIMTMSIDIENYQIVHTGEQVNT